MIQIEAIHIKEFRGIRSLDLQPKCKSFAVWGPNGSGKSGVVDAIDFALTGSISRLSGQGTGSMSARTHGPHVHKRDNPEEAKVELTVRDVATGKTSILTRCAKTPQFYTLKPDTPQIRAAINQMQQHPEITLSRREIIKFILIEPSRRSEQLQALLKLDRFDQARKLLISARTKASDEHKNAGRELTAAESGIKTHLKVDLVSAATMTTAINARRETLGLSALTQVTPETDLSTGIASKSASSDISKPTAIREVEDLQSRINDYTPLTAASQQLTAALNDLSTDPTLLLALQHRSLLDAGISLVTEAACPLCDQPWDNIDALKNHLQEKLARSQAAADLETRIKTASTTVVTELRSVADLVKRVQRWAAACGLLEPQHQLNLWDRNLTELAGALSTVEGAANQQGRIASNILRTPTEVIIGLTDLHVALEAIPDQTEAVAARSFLTVAQDRWIRLCLARLSHKKATSAKNIAALVYDTYCAVSDNAMSTLYKSIENDFGGYYRRINSDDESFFTAQLSPSSGKLDFKVDFHGQGMYPPAAYHECYSKPVI
jgi:DNA repair ATPase RecN